MTKMTDEQISECLNQARLETDNHCESLPHALAKAQADAYFFHAIMHKSPALKFANHVINGVMEGGNWDGEELQALAVEYGLLEPKEMAGPCMEEGCNCALYGADFPTICYHKTYPVVV